MTDPQDSSRTISGFSKLTKRGKIKWLVENFFRDPESVMRELKSYWLENEADQKIIDEISENTISNFLLPLGVAPNFIIDGHAYVIPMVIEESSVVAAASAAAKFWLTRGGFTTTIEQMLKVGQVHFRLSGDFDLLVRHEDGFRDYILAHTQDLTERMEARGGGIRSIEWIDLSADVPQIYQLRVRFETCDSMGANFINSILERIAELFPAYIAEHDELNESIKDLETIMSILSNYTPECMVRAEVQCPIENLGTMAGDMSARDFANRFYTAVEIARHDPYRAVTHNKGIFNGVDAVVLATGNDFRAVEACGHAHAARDGQYRSLSHCSIEGGVFRFWIELPLSVGTVGGLTKLHPIASRSLEMLGHPSARQLMSIIASVGLAQNFAALRSLVTTGIQKGHMRMHLMNILRQLGATEEQATGAQEYFHDKVVSYSAVRSYLGIDSSPGT